MVLNESFYLTEDKVSFYLQPGRPGKVTGKNAIPNMSANFEQAFQRLESTQHDFVYEVFQLDCHGTAKNGTFACMWHIYALASVIGQSIISVYPNKAVQARPALHKIAYPRCTIPFPATNTSSVCGDVDSS